LRPLVLALLDSAAELRQRQHRHVELLGQCFQSPGDLGNLLHAVLLPALARRRQELQVVDDQQSSPCVRFQTACARAQGGDGERGVSSMKKFKCSSSWLTESTRSKSELISSPLRIFSDGMAACSEIMRVASCFGRHFEREEADHGAVGYLRLAVLAMLLAVRPWRR